MWTIKSLLEQSRDRLKKAGIDNAGFEARLLLSKTLGLTQEFTIGHEDHPLTQDQATIVQQAILARSGHKPVAKILGRKDFWTLSFDVNEHTLDPRPETEILIDVTLELFPDKDKPLRILDLGTGSGCLILSLLNEFKQAKGVGVDISEQALDVAQKNAKDLRLEDRCQLIHSNWLDQVTGAFDLVVSNPPYIAENELENLGPELNFDPKGALVSGQTGLECYEILAKGLGRVLKPGAVGLFEIGWKQEDTVSNLLKENGFEDINCHRDLNNHPRCLYFKKVG